MFNIIWKIIPLALVGLMFANCGRRHCGWGHGGGFSEKKADWMVKKVSSKLDLTDAQKAKLVDVKDYFMVQKPRMKARKESMFQLFKKEIEKNRLDEVALNVAFDEMQKEMTVMRKGLITRVAAFHSTLDEKQKKEIVEHMTSHHEKCNKD